METLADHDTSIKRPEQAHLGVPWTPYTQTAGEEGDDCRADCGRPSLRHEQSDSATLVEYTSSQRGNQLENLVESILVAPTLAMIALLYLVAVLPLTAFFFFVRQRQVEASMLPLRRVWERASHCGRNRTPISPIDLIFFTLLSPLLTIILGIIAMFAGLMMLYSFILSEESEPVLLYFITQCRRNWANTFADESTLKTVEPHEADV